MFIFQALALRNHNRLIKRVRETTMPPTNLPLAAVLPSLTINEITTSLLNVWNCELNDAFTVG